MFKTTVLQEYQCFLSAAAQLELEVWDRDSSCNWMIFKGMAFKRPSYVLTGSTFLKLSHQLNPHENEWASKMFRNPNLRFR